jgi:hypothetical protein
MLVFLEAIKFNHDKTSQTTGAFNIRRNETRIVTVPEWQRDSCFDPRCSPVAYSISNLPKTITIQASFKCDDPTVTTIKVRAVDAHSGAPTNILGSIPEHDIPLVQGLSGYQNISLPDAKIAADGVGVEDVAWTWQFQTTAGWGDFETTRHRIYVVLRTPNEPWEPKSDDPSNIQVPWTEILEYACTWAGNAVSVDEAANQINQNVRDLENKLRVVYQPSPAFYSDPTFDATKFLDLLKGGKGKAYKLNCSDCATVVSAFANIVGCDLWQATMGWNFTTNPVVEIGRRSWNVREYNYHEVAWKWPCTENEEVFDACLQLDSDRHPSEEPHRPSQPSDLRFGKSNERLYRFRLAAPPDNQPDPSWPSPQLDSRQRRRIFPHPEGSLRVHPELLNLLMKFYGYEQWQFADKASPNLFIESFPLPGQRIVGFEMFPPQLIYTTNWPRTVHWVGKGSDQFDLIRIDGQVCSSPEEARYFLMQTLAQFQCPTLVRRDDLEIGDIAFVEEEQDAIVFAMGNVVTLVRNAGRTSLDFRRVAQAVDDALKSTPVSVGVKLEETPSFTVASMTVSVGQPVILQPIREQTAVSPVHKFFSESGSVIREGDNFIYQSQKSGPQTLTIFAIDQAGKTARQELVFDVKAPGGN